MFCLQSHYRKPLLFNYEVLDNVKVAYEKLLKRIAGLGTEGELQKEQMAQYQDAFMQALGNDINTSQALTVVYDVLKAELNDASKRVLIEEFDTVLSLNLTKEAEKEEVDTELASYVEDMIAQRKEARKAKDFAKADAIREELLEKGIEIKDTREGTTWSLIQ